MNLNISTVTRITALVTKILHDHGSEIAEILQLLGVKPAVAPPPVPVPLPAPVDSLPVGFDEAFYLETYPDVANAVRLGYYRSGGHHYIMDGFKEGRVYRRPAAPPPVPPPAPTPAYPRDEYPSLDALLADCRERKLMTMIHVDGTRVWEGDGFGPPLSFYRRSDGVLVTSKPPTVERKPGDQLLDVYDSKRALLADVEAVRWDWAVLVDGEVIRPGFEADRPAIYFTRDMDRKLVRK
ncbi:MAG TPA: hypothetical protein PLL30_16910 [Candidatus Krumholzibacteria bacterium]|nr:hypothetical protein [Candidatus Krumholzibacteria bacterium]HRY42177.1 hypothetical protein [Candidatus Krumholzibacteria bacterium]